jgi:site-specific recombinase
MNFFKKTVKNNIEQRTQEHLESYTSTTEDSLEFLVQLVRLIRPENPKAVAVVDIQDIIAMLERNEHLRTIFSEGVKSLLYGKRFYNILSDAAILKDVDFISEVKRRVYAKFLPHQPQKDSLEYVLNQVFYKATDPIWLIKIPSSQIERFFELLDLQSIYHSTERNTPLSEVMLAMNLISQRMSGRVLEADVMNMVPEYEGFESPFAAFEKELLQIERRVKSSEAPNYIASTDLSYKQLLVLHKQCEDFVDKAFQNSSKFGISLRVNQSLLRVRQQLYRLKVLIPTLIVDSKEKEIPNSIQLAYKVIKYHCQKTNVRKLINDSTQLLSYEVTQHTAKTGEKYITEGRREYFKMFNAALGGGLVVGFLCIFKILLGKITTSDFNHAFLYSMNYSLGFITIYILGFTLATKQPAMTASALIRVLEEGMKKQGSSHQKHQSFAKLFARVFRSQFIAFVGNVIMAFPVSLLLIWLIDLVFKYNIAEAKWNTLLTDLSPVHSLAVFHAAIAGVFLFLSGIISGSVANRDKHYQVYYRIQEHPWLKRTVGKEKTQKIAKLYEHKWSGIISNFWFGIFMGSTATIGLFFGLNLDIRHITFASGNLALGMYGAHFVVDFWMIFWGIFGIGVIGLVNFLVSFSLSLGLAFRSRNIPLTELKIICASIWQHFKHKPMSFFFPTERKGVSATSEI